MGVLGAAIARSRMICMGLPVQGKQKLSGGSALYNGGLEVWW